MSDGRLGYPGIIWHRYSIGVAATAVLLIWWGAAVTTEQAGMAFADWPLSQGSVNPEGWLKHLPYFLEHGHRLIASLVGLLTLGLFATAFVRNKKNVVELILLVLALALMVELVRRAGAEKVELGRKETLLWASLAVGVVVVAWLVGSWRFRQWTLACRLSALALLLVVFQAVLGGIRVTEISDSYAVAHGCLAHGFFCLLIFIILASSPRWPEWRLESDAGVRKIVRRVAPLLCSAVFVQLILGALMRHHHRYGLADTGILLTGGEWWPDFDASHEILLIMFLHKYWGALVAVSGLWFAAWALRQAGAGKRTKRLVAATAFFLLIQIGLGVCVILTDKSFWLTNFHVLNGVLILALSFVLAIFSQRSGSPVAAEATGGAEKGALLPGQS
jgi:cytochrome c oxidase assembly protein subunit 15